MHSIIPWIAIAFFLAALIAVRKYAELIARESRSSWRHVSSGLVLLSLSAVARLFHENGLLARAPFFSEEIFFELAFWILVISGGTLLVNGVAEWLPLSRQSRRLIFERANRLELLQRVEQLVGVDNRLESLLCGAVRHMKEHLSVGYGAVFMFETGTRRMTVAAVSDDFPVSRGVLQSAICAMSELGADNPGKGDQPPGLTRFLPASLGNPTLTVPIRVANETVGLFVFWDSAENIGADDRLLLQLAADVVARKILADRLARTVQADQGQAEWLLSLQSAVAKEDDSRRRVLALVRGLVQKCSFDSFALTHTYRGDGLRTRYSLGSAGLLLIQHNLPPLPSGALTHIAAADEDPIVFQDLPPDRQPSPLEIITGGSIGSLIAIPVRIHRDMMATLTLAARRRGAFSHATAKLVTQASPAVLLALMPDILESAARADRSRLETVSWVAQLIGESNVPEEVVRVAASAVAEQTGADFVRISTLDESGAFLESQAVVSSLSTEFQVPPDGKMVLSLMPRHRQALDTLQSLVLTSRAESDALSATEARQIFSEGLRWVAIVPIVAGGKSTGTVTLGGEAIAGNLTANSGPMLFAQAVASMLAHRLTTAADSQILPEAAFAVTHTGTRRAGKPSSRHSLSLV
ncbi:MAG: hypothetical protein AB1772_09590 [Candidatus Zixiibacteriota bacterium]